MRSKNIVLSLTIITFLLSIYYLSFTFVDYRVQRHAEQQAMDAEGKVDFDKKQHYLMEQWKKPVYNLLGATYTYEEVKERSCKLGLDLQGGMHVTMELSPVELVKGLASYHRDPSFVEALQWAQREREKGAPASFSKLFVEAYKRMAPEGDIRDIFATATNRARAYTFSSEQDVIRAIDQEIANALDRSLTIVRSRLDRFGASQPNIQQLPGTGRIQIDLPGVTSPERVRKLLQGVGQLRFWEVAEVEEYGPQWEAVNNFLLDEEKKALEATLPKDITEEEKAQRMPKQSMLQRLSKCPFSSGLAYAPQDMDQIEAILRKEKVKSLLPQITWMWEKKEHTLKDGTQAVTLYAIKQSKEQKPLLEGDIITHATQNLGEANEPCVSMRMNSKGAQIWKRITANNIGKRIAIVLDNRVYSAPMVQQEIPNGYSQISGSFTVEEAKDLASILQTGSLPAPLKMVEEVIMGPSLGKMAQTQGLVTTALGLGLVLLFMIVYYAKGGIIANIALLFNLLFIVSVLAQLDATLTLPGIAGLVLTIGMSIDANVLIFERIREELAKKVHIKEAIIRGYEKSYSSIIDSNVTTFLTGVILFYLGQGPVRSFAIILMIGIISSVFSSIFITRLFFSFFIDGYRTPNLTFSYGKLPTLFKDIQINFIKNRYRFYAFSLSFIALGAFCFYQNKGLTLGVDFVGGRSYVVNFYKPMDSSFLKKELSSSFEESVEVRTYGTNSVMQITTSYLSNEDAPETDKKVKCKLVTALKALTPLEKTETNQAPPKKSFSIISSSKVGATVAQDVQKSAKKAIALALFGIFLYVALRFKKWAFGLAAVCALIHDVLMVMAGFSIARTFGYNYEVNEVFLAAMLTVIGYSINDTVVIFDRIREKLINKTAAVDINVINHSIRETLSRTIITSLTTLLAVSMLFFFGGEALRSFSFALLLGVLFGTYSSICIAAPLMADFGGKSSILIK
ncbi:protein translocase subunit SecDF [Candidatus Cardinium hertigii]|uniref:Multifunctional fusion protein n=1 Tax=Candidatus Cardinium hertigii TaxID=247481 RepID=A0A3N2QBG5_9BACT|nr:protein translocase subunit SecDF [Candidatus Cardinium hertigii]ROT47154.1 protein translocase subunit SecDF [Candidatus Cardinium hertigii]